MTTKNRPPLTERFSVLFRKEDDPEPEDLPEFEEGELPGGGDMYIDLFTDLEPIEETCEESGFQAPPYDLDQTARFRYYTNKPELTISAGTTNGTIVVGAVTESEETACEVVFDEDDSGTLDQYAAHVTKMWWKGIVKAPEPGVTINGTDVQLSAVVTGVLVVEFRSEWLEVRANPAEYDPATVHIHVCQGDHVESESYEVSPVDCCDMCDVSEVELYLEGELMEEEGIVSVYPGSSVPFNVIGGCPPFLWTTSGDGMHMSTDKQAPRHFESDPLEWVSEPTDERESSLIVHICACRDPNEGPEADVTVVDDCGNSASVKIFEKRVCCVGDLRPDPHYLPAEMHDVPEHLTWIGVIPVDPAECTDYEWTVREGEGIEFRKHDVSTLVHLHRKADEELCGPIVVRCEDKCGRYCDIPVTEIPRNTCCSHFDFPEPTSDAILPIERGKEYRLDFKGGKPTYTWTLEPEEIQGFSLRWPYTSAPTNYITAGPEVCTDQICTVVMKDSCESEASRSVQVDELEFEWHPDNPTKFPPEGEAMFKVVGGALPMTWTRIPGDDFYIESTDPEYPETGPLPEGREVKVLADDPCAIVSGGFDLKVEDACGVLLETHIESEPYEFKWHEDTWTGTYGFGYAELYLENGVPPFQWKVISGDGHIGGDLETWDRHNVVFRDECAEGTIVVEVEDACFDKITTTIELPESQAMECSDITPESIAPNGSEEIAVIYGTGPFTWEVEGDGFTLAHSVTAYRSNILTGNGVCSGATGTVSFTVTDKCNNSVTCTLDVEDTGDFRGNPGNPIAFESSSETVGTLDGKKPLQWEVSTGFTLAFSETMGDTNQVTMDNTCSQYSRCTITVTDACDKVTSFGLAPPFPEVFVNGYDTMFHGESSGVNVEGGIGPFTWEISGEGFALADPDTEGRVNTVVPTDDCFESDSVSVTATDSCGESDTHTITVAGEDGPLRLVANYSEVDALQIVVLTVQGTGRSPFEWTADSGFKLSMPVTNDGTNKMQGTEKCATGSVTVTVTDYCDRSAEISIPIKAINPLEVQLPEEYIVADQSVSVIGGRAEYVWNVTDGWEPSQEVTGGQHNLISEVDPCVEAITVSVHDACNASDSAVMTKEIPGITWDGPEAMDGSCNIAVLDGTPPFHWEVSDGFALGAEDTGGRTNTLSTVDGYCGVAEVTVTDRCGKTTNGAVLTVGGSWATLCRSGPYNAACGGAGPGYHTETIESGHKVVRISACLGDGWTDETRCGGPCGPCISCGGFTHCAAPEHCTWGSWCISAYGVIIVYKWAC